MSYYKSIILGFVLLSIWSCLPDREPKIDTMDDNISEEEAFFSDYDAPKMKFGYINISGQLVIADIYDGVREFSNDFAATNINGKWGYIDRFGETVIPHEYRSAFAFKQDIARVQDFDKKYWFIDRKGNKLNSVGFDVAYDCLDGRIRVRTEQGYNFINIEGDTLLPDLLDGAKDFYREMAIIQKGDLFGVISKEGDPILKIEFDRVHVDEEFIRAKKDGLFYVYNSKGNKLSETGFQKLSAFQENLAAAKVKDRWKLISTTGKSIHQFPDDIIRVEPAGENNWRVISTDGISLINSEARLLTKRSYEQVFNFSEGMAAFSRNEKWGYLNAAGEEQIAPIFDLIWDFKDGRARVVTNGGIGFIDKVGTLVIRPIFFEVKDFEQGRARVQIYRG